MFTNSMGQKVRHNRHSLFPLHDIEDYRWGHSDAKGGLSWEFLHLHVSLPTALTKVTQRLGLTATVHQITYSWPLHVAWDSHSMVLGSRGSLLRTWWTLHGLL